MHATYIKKKETICFESCTYLHICFFVQDMKSVTTFLKLCYVHYFMFIILRKPHRIILQLHGHNLAII